jgi:hypothetical protein
MEPGTVDQAFMERIRAHIKDVKGFDAKPGQVAALYWALIGPQDVLF